MSTSRLDKKKASWGWTSPSRQSWPESQPGRATGTAHPSFPDHPFRQLALSGVLAIPGPRSRRRAGATRLFRRGMARAAGRSPRGRLRRPHTRRALQRRGAPLAPRTRAAALGGARGRGRRRTTPRGLGRRSHPGRGRPGHGSSVAEAELRSSASRPSVLGRQGSTVLSYWCAETLPDRRSSPT